MADVALDGFCLCVVCFGFCFLGFFFCATAALATTRTAASAKGIHTLFGDPLGCLITAAQSASRATPRCRRRRRQAVPPRDCSRRRPGVPWPCRRRRRNP